MLTCADVRVVRPQRNIVRRFRAALDGLDGLDPSASRQVTPKTPKTPPPCAAAGTDVPGVKGVTTLMREVPNPADPSNLSKASPSAPFEVVVAAQTVRVESWSGQPLGAGMIGVDTETAAVDGLEVPALALMAAAAHDQVVLIHPHDAVRFCELHTSVTWALHNAAFDLWVLHNHLVEARHPRLAAQLFEMAGDGRVRDSMLLDQLIRLARDGFRDPVPRALDIVASEWAGVTELNKSDSFRLRYGEIIGVDWSTVDRAFFEYAAKDPLATLFAYEAMAPMAQSIMREHAAKIHADAAGTLGLLTERVQVAGAVALAQIQRNGIHIDAARRDSKAAQLRLDIAAKAREVAVCVDHIVAGGTRAGPVGVTDIFVRDGAGRIQHTPTGLPKTRQSALQEVLWHEACRIGYTPPLTSSGKLSTKLENWKALRMASPFVKAWLELRELEQPLKYVSSAGEHLHPRYTVLKRTGRTSASGPPIQQVPRAGGYREMHVPSPGSVFLVIDYSFIELVTLAATCLVRLGRSVLADAIRAGIDPHINTAALLNGMSLEQFAELKAADPDCAKDLRQKAKALNFGVPGGLGSAALREYAQANYKVEMTLDEAAAFRARLITDVYPEIGAYLGSNTMATVASRLGCTEDQLWAAMGCGRYDRPDWLPRVVAKLLSGVTTKKGGEPYAVSTTDRVWGGLYACCHNEALRPLLMTRGGGPQLTTLAMEDAVTISGRVRGRVRYTDSRNTPFQGLAADGAKLALFELVREGYRIAAFIHDEVIVELPMDADHTREAERIRTIMCEAMQRVLFAQIPVRAEFALAKQWSKRAEEARDTEGQLVPWEPNTP